MKDNTQELEAIINNLSGKYSGSIASAMLAGGNPEETIFMMNKYGKEAKQALLDWHNKQVKSEPNKCEFGHQLYGHKTAEGWCCACEADQAFWQSEVNKQIEAVLDRLEKQAVIFTSLSGEKAGIIDLTAVENERNKLEEAEL